MSWHDANTEEGRQFAAKQARSTYYYMGSVALICVALFYLIALGN